jgi:hypothetical protein
MSAVRFAVTWLAAWCQVIAVVTMPLGLLDASAGPFGNAPICHSDAGGGRPSPAQLPHPGHDCVLCAVCLSHAGSMALPASPPTLPHQRRVALVGFGDAQPRAPPSLGRIAAQPRGPPTLI